LASSIERFGQILPVIVLRQGVNSFVLIDGYLRNDDSFLGRPQVLSLSDLFRNDSFHWIVSIYTPN